MLAISENVKKRIVDGGGLTRNDEERNERFIDLAVREKYCSSFQQTNGNTY